VPKAWGNREKVGIGAAKDAPERSRKKFSQNRKILLANEKSQRTIRGSWQQGLPAVVIFDKSICGCVRMKILSKFSTHMWENYNQ
jgi:hypothetical protein